MSRLHWQGQSWTVEPGQSALEVLEAAGLSPGSSCRSGLCHSCMVRVVSGSVPARAQASLTPGQRARGLALSCVCCPREDIELAPVLAEDAPRPAVLLSRRRRGDTLLLELSVPGLHCRGGQFLSVVRPDGLARPYSVAGVRGSTVMLHVSVLPDGRMGNWLARAPLGTTLSARQPAGECVYVDEPERPLVLAGLGTGLAPLMGILEEARDAGHRAPVHLFFGARAADGLYLAPELRGLARSWPGLHLHLGALDAQGQADVHEGALEDAILADAARVAAARHYLCGAPAWVHGLQRRLFLAGASLARIHADAFVMAPA